MSNFADWALLVLVCLAFLAIAFFCWCMFNIEEINPPTDSPECPACKKPNA